MPLAGVPGSTTANCGEASVVNAQNGALTVELPTPFVNDETYALRVFRSGSAATPEFKINDARPRWVSPSRVYISAPVPGAQDTPRKLKVVGRNLQHRPGQVTKVKLRRQGGIGTYEVTADDLGAALNHYVAQITLPASLACASAPCTYKVDVSRDGGSTYVTAVQNLIVDANPTSPPEFWIDDYTGCTPDDANDDSACVLEAIEDAGNNGTVVFPSGTWVLNPNGYSTGIVVPAGVNLLGQGSQPSQTTIKRHASWETRAVFVLAGKNQVSNIRFLDDHAGQGPTCGLTDCTVVLQIGEQGTGAALEDFAIFDNRFENSSFFAIGDEIHDSLRRTVRRVYIRRNTFEAYNTAIMIGSWGKKDDEIALTLEDSIIAHNDFRPAL
jgi:hypothetical protein